LALRERSGDPDISGSFGWCAGNFRCDLDGGFESAEQVLGRLYHPLLATTDPTALGKDPKTRLQEYLQAKRLALPQYAIVTVSGEAHEQHFRVECAVPELGIHAYGEGANRRAAEQEAARSAYALAAETK